MYILMSIVRVKFANAAVSFSENGCGPGYVSEHGLGDTPASENLKIEIISS